MESKKVYVHYEGKPEYTHVAKITGGVTAEQLAVEFTRVYNAKHGRMVSLDPDAIHLLNGRRRMSKTANLIRLVKDRSDIFVEYEVPSNARSSDPVEPMFSSNDEINGKQQGETLPETLVEEVQGSEHRRRVGADQQQVSSEAELVCEVRRPLASEQDVDDPGKDLQGLDVSVLRDWLVKALKYQQEMKYKLAGNVFLEVLKVQPKNRICLRGLGSIGLAVNNFLEALTWLQRGVEEYPQDILFHARLGDAYSGLGKYKEALSAYDVALGLAVEQQPATGASMDSLTLSDQTANPEVKPNVLEARHSWNVYEGGSADDPTAGDIQGPVTLEGLQSKVLIVDGLQISSAAVLRKMGQEELASSILTKIILQNPENWDALYQYGILILGQGLTKEALKIFLKLLISKPGDKSIHSSLSKAIKHPQGMELLRSEVVLEPPAAPALAFLASCIKDHGAIDEAVELYKLAIKLSPSSVGYILNVIHLYEVMYEYLKALGLAVSLFQSFPSFSLNKLQFSDVLPYFEGANWSESPDNISQQCECQDWKFEAQAEFLRWFDALPADKQVDRGEISPIADDQPVETRKHDFKCTYDQQHLEGLAVLFTVTKILFIGGALERAKQLARIIEPARAASCKPLHQTMIRNEAAYFASVHQILEKYPVRLPPRLNDQPPLYLAGDSHCMSAAWRTVQLRGRTRLLVPMLVTGLKVWHLRPESEFYPKVAFQNAMQSVAYGAQLVMLYGEIDCRESILVSVEKGFYKTVQEGVEVVVNVYLEVLQQLIFNRGFELFVHPIPPVLNETRPIVHVFNRILKQSLDDIKKRSPVGKRLHWLDLVPGLLTGEGFLKDEFKLDGTHLSPAYKSLLQRELLKVK